MSNKLSINYFDMQFPLQMFSVVYVTIYRCLFLKSLSYFIYCVMTEYVPYKFNQALVLLVTGEHK